MGEHPTSSAVPTSIAFGLCDGTPTLGLRLRSPLPSIMYKELTKVNNREKNFPWLVWLLDIVPPVHTPYRPSRVAVHSDQRVLDASRDPWLSSPPPGVILKPRSNCSLDCIYSHRLPGPPLCKITLSTLHCTLGCWLDPRTHRIPYGTRATAHASDDQTAHDTHHPNDSPHAHVALSRANEVTNEMYGKDQQHTSADGARVRASRATGTRPTATFRWVLLSPSRGTL